MFIIIGIIWLVGSDVYFAKNDYPCEFPYSTISIAPFWVLFTAEISFMFYKLDLSKYISWPSYYTF